MKIKEINILKLFLCVIVFIFYNKSNIILSKTIFVSNNGDNNSFGSFSFPFKTIQFGLNNLNDGDTLYIRGGCYYETLEFSKKKFNKKTTVKNFNNEFVEIKNLNKIDSYYL